MFWQDMQQERDSIHRQLAKFVFPSNDRQLQPDSEEAGTHAVSTAVEPLWLI
jgi:hypothetical protein